MANQVYVEFTTSPAAQTIAVFVKNVSFVQPASTTTAYIYFDEQQLEVVGDYATVRDQIANA